jgi:hypothetical protein
MADLSAERTLVKSPPELWSELSELERLARHLDAFGDIRITRLEPEKQVAWEADGATGTISLEPSGWGTKVTLTAELEDESPPADEEPEDVQQPVQAAPDPTRASRWLDRVFPGWRAPGYQQYRDPPPEPATQPTAPPAPATPPAPDETGARKALDEVLDTLGAAHHRPFSRG